MSSSPSLPSYEKLDALFRKLKSNFDPAQTHGILCGHLCITPDLEKSDLKFEKSIFSEEINAPSNAVLTDLYKASYHSIKQYSFEFSLILPNDDADLNKRVEALGLWCQGFLMGVAQSPVPLDDYQEKEIMEALGDLAEIAQVNFGDIPENEEDEGAYLELVEFARLTALMLFNTIQSNPLSQQKSALLH